MPGRRVRWHRQTEAGASLPSALNLPAGKVLCTSKTPGVPEGGRSVSLSGTAPRSGVTTAGVSFWRICIADDTKIRVFDVTGPQPREVDGLDRKIRKEINAHIPTDESTLWLVYPQTCFAANDSSTIIVVADAPHVQNEAGSPGKPLKLRITVSLANIQIRESIVEPSDKRSSLAK